MFFYFHTSILIHHSTITDLKNAANEITTYYAHWKYLKTAYKNGNHSLQIHGEALIDQSALSKHSFNS